MVVGYIGHPTPPGVWAEEKLEPFSGIFSRDAGFVRRVELPDTVLVRDFRVNENVFQTTPMLADDGDVYLVMVGEKPALSVVRPDGAVPRTVELHIPSGHRLSEAQVAGARLISHLDETNHTGHPFINHDQFAELDAESGDVLLLHSLPGIALRPGCQRQSGITALDAGTLDTLMVPAGDDTEVRGPNKVP